MQRKKKAIIISAAIVCVAAIGIVIAILVAKLNDQREQAEQQKVELEQKELEMEQLRLSHEYDELEKSFELREGEMVIFNNDSIRQEYEKAKNRVEELSRELREQKNLSQKRITELQNEISTLKDILRHYVEQIDELQKENQALTEQNETLTRKNNELSNQVTKTTNQNKELSQRMELAEKLNVSNVNLQALSSKGKTEKKVKKAKQLAVTLTIPQNNSTPVGTKSIFVRITSPEGNLLRDNGITFPFEGATIEATAKKDIEYDGNEIAGLTIYWDNNTTLNPGLYRVELFADNFRIYSRELELK